MSKKVTIKDISKQTGVSIATVSHVINHTRYVSPELVEKVERCIRETGYDEKIANKIKSKRMGKDACIVGIFPNWSRILYQDMMIEIRRIVAREGYHFYAMCSEDSIEEEAQIIQHLQMDRSIAGIFFVPLSNSVTYYNKLFKAEIPMVCLENSVLSMNVDTVVFEYRKALYKGMKYLLECGHENIVFFRNVSDSLSIQEQTKGYRDALKEVNKNISDGNIVDIDLHWPEEKCQKIIQKALKNIRPTAAIVGGNRMTRQVVLAVKNIGMQIPGEISIVGFGDDTWVNMVDPELTILKRDIKGLCDVAGEKLFNKIKNQSQATQTYAADIELQIRNSVRMLDDGYFGEKPVSPEQLTLTPEERKQLRQGKYRVAISFHYTGTAWAAMHEAGIRDELEQYGMEVISVMDAHFDADLQIKQLESISIQKPDAVIAIPVDDRLTAEAFRNLSVSTKLIFISNIPEGFEKNDYVSCISVNEWENGTNAGKLLGNYFKNNNLTKAAFITHGATFGGTRVRDNAARKVLQENYPDIEIVASKSFGNIENAYELGKEMLQQNPEIEGIYISWDRPALEVLRGLSELGRNDIVIFTTDLDQEIAKYVEKGIVKGLSTQRPYEQGRALALAAAKSLVSDFVPKYIGVQPYVVEPQGLKRAWRDIFHKQME